MAFDPKEPRDPHSGKWTLAAIAEHIGSLSQGGQGNRTSMRGIEVRRHQSGEVNVKIRGESRRYGTHQEAAKAVHGQQHTSAGARHDAVREAAKSMTSGRTEPKVPAKRTAPKADQASEVRNLSPLQKQAYYKLRNRDLTHSEAMAKLKGKGGK